MRYIQPAFYPWIPVNFCTYSWSNLSGLLGPVPSTLMQNRFLNMPSPLNIAITKLRLTVNLCFTLIFSVKIVRKNA